ncbi:MAG: acyltransferase family protein [Ornithinimicrobium sp.]|uniref:acyltransferase family protein n=1 Tax=Ornithinimicrobium sp. TaxID=1977084 RepID=UPI0026E0BFEF|nr:acyltransferase family protein [Ornithinimicrobium sp.]MDO5739183.1 acyltransferase family protein [Ornithinimicrobium sp.]
MSMPARQPDVHAHGTDDTPPAPRPEALYAPTRHGDRHDLLEADRTAYPLAQDRTDTGPVLQTRDTPPRRRRGGRGPNGIRPRPGIIPGLDGLRAIAVIGVLIFHFTPSVLPGGYLGVDVFFVLSGFLITTLLLREVDTKGRIDLLGFWRRRARRLLPALVLVVLVSTSVARLVGGDLLVGIGRQALGALTFTTNWLEILAGASYFHSTSPILFINFWSLAVEEQFYLVWPLALIIALALTRSVRQLILLVAGIGVASTIAMAVLFTPGVDATRVYYGTDTHLMGLMAGAAFAVAWADPRHRAGLRSGVWRRWRWAAVLGALLGLVGLMRWMEESDALTFRGGILLASLLTVVLIAGLLESGSLWRRLMHLRPLVWVGERSYGIYLWHWPILVIMGALIPYAPGTGHGMVVVGTALVLTLTISALSFRYVEQPVRKLGLRKSVGTLGRWAATPWQVSRTPRMVAGLLALMLVATAVAVATAPEKSVTQQQIEANEARLDGGQLAPVASTTVGEPAQLSAQLGLAGAAADAATAAASESDSKGTKDDKTSNDKTSADQGDKASADKDAPASATATATSLDVHGSTYRAGEDGLLVPDSSAITAIGDSLIVTSADGLTYRFPEINYLAKSNRQWNSAHEVVADGLAQDQIRDNVILHLGTNAGVDEAALRETLDALGPDRNVVVMNLYVAASFTESSNATIAKVVADYPHAVVGRWNATISKQPGVLQADNVHPDLDGMHVYATVVAEAFDELARAQ